MRRYVGLVLALVGVFVALTAAPLAAEGRPPRGEQIEVSGDFTTTGTFIAGCSLLRQLLDGGGDWTGLGPSTLSLDICPDFSTGVILPVDGEFTIEAAAGAVSGTLEGTFTPEGAGYRMDLVLTVASGTGRFSGATGTIDLDGTLLPGGFDPVPVSEAWGTVDGTLSLPPTTPTTRADCREGGWRHFVDEEGKPFRSRGNCTAFVDRLP
jgi:hypothetical protein